jgi:hypothetical protein
LVLKGAATPNLFQDIGVAKDPWVLFVSSLTLSSSAFQMFLSRLFFCYQRKEITSIEYSYRHHGK